MNFDTVAIKYMGSKRSLAPKIARKISRQHSGATVLDVFSGMCAVGTEVASRHPLYTNDVHAFAEVVAQALFVADDRSPNAREMSKLLAAFDKNKRALSHVMDERLKRERNALAAVANSNDGWKKLRAFTERELLRAAPTRCVGLHAVEIYRQSPRLFPYCLASSYFASAYFGLSQSIEIDSLRYAIDQAPAQLRARYLCALIQAVSHCATAPGHFAQFLIPRDKENTLYMSRIRQRSVLTRFLAALVSFPAVQCLDRKQNRVFRSDATDLLRENSAEFPKKNFVIYADPPYSKAQYSRYYHVLESIVLYDYPSCDGKGRYRNDRFLTDFSRVAGVVGAMDNFVEAAAALDAPLYISYPRAGLLSTAGGDLRNILKKHYKVVNLVAHLSLNHSTMGGAPGMASVRALEDVYYAGRN
jgi:adenine-specific DNA-methyltransferase